MTSKPVEVEVKTEFEGGDSQPRLISSDGRTFTVGDLPLIIGRSPDVEVVLNDANVSRQHAEVWRTSEGVAIRDLQSTNGTYVNGHRIIGRLAVTPRRRDHRHVPLSDRARLSLVAASTNYAAIIRPLQVLVIVVAVLFFLRVMRVMTVQARPVDFERTSSTPTRHLGARVHRTGGSKRRARRGEHWCDGGQK